MIQCSISLKQTRENSRVKLVMSLWIRQKRSVNVLYCIWRRPLCQHCITFACQLCVQFLSLGWCFQEAKEMTILMQNWFQKSKLSAWVNGWWWTTLSGSVFSAFLVELTRIVSPLMNTSLYVAYCICTSTVVVSCQRSLPSVAMCWYKQQKSDI